VNLNELDVREVLLNILMYQNTV